MKLIYTRKYETIMVDKADYVYLNQFTWRLNRGYAVTNVKGKKVYMHRMILGITDSKIQTDHINHNKLDNRRYNIRACSIRQNLKNRKKQPNCTSIYKGVSLCSTTNKWVSSITHNYKKMHLGTFVCEKEAAEAYDEAAKKYHKEFCNLNFPKECR